MISDWDEKETQLLSNTEKVWLVEITIILSTSLIIIIIIIISSSYVTFV